jgi:hypothetical protein
MLVFTLFHRTLLHMSAKSWRHLRQLKGGVPVAWMRSRSLRFRRQWRCWRQMEGCQTLPLTLS